MLDKICLFLSTGFGAGQGMAVLVSRWRGLWRLPPIQKWSGAGWVGSLQGLLLYFLLPNEPILKFALLVAGTLLAVGISQKAERILQTHDDPRIIIDEIVGMLWSLVFLPFSNARVASWIIFLAAFILFRIFDVAKWPWKGAQKLPGGWGIVIDDVFAGMLANAILQIILRAR